MSLVLFSKFGPEITRSIRILSASIILLCLWGCSQVKPINFVPPSKVAPAPEAWKYVAVGEIKASILASGRSRSVTVDPVADLRAALAARFGEGAERPVALVSDNVEVAVGGDGFGLRGDFYLRTATAISAPIHVEHSVVARGNGGISRDSVYSRLIVDVCDAILSDRAALAFLQSPEAVVESAVADPKSAVGPVTQLAAEAPPFPTGRIVWGTGDSFFGLDAMVLLGDFIVAGAGVVVAKSNKIFHYRLSALLGGGGPKGGGAGVFMFNIGVDLLIGYRHTVKNDKGYVDYPGVSFGIGPSTNPMHLMSDAFSMTVFPVGGKAVIDLPFGRKFGLSAGYWIGASIVDGSAGTMSFSSVSFSHTPSFDLWLDLGGSRISLGGAFQAMGQGTSAFKNPMFNLSITKSQGRGVGKHTKSVVAAGSTLVDEKEDLTTPVNLFQSIPPAAAPTNPAAPLAPVTPTAPVDSAIPQPAAYGPQAPPGSPPQFGAPMPIPDPQCTEHCQQMYVTCAQVQAAGCALGGQLAGKAVSAAVDKVPGKGVGAVAGALAAELTQEQCNALLTPCENMLHSCIPTCPTVLAPTAAPQAPVPGPQAVPVPGPASGGCGKDTDCKGDRVCFKGECISAESAAAAEKGALPAAPAPMGAIATAPVKSPPSGQSTFIVPGSHATQPIAAVCTVSKPIFCVGTERCLGLQECAAQAGGFGPCVCVEGSKTPAAGALADPGRIPEGLFAGEPQARAQGVIEVVKRKQMIALEKLKAIASGDADEGVRRIACWAIGEIGGASEISVLKTVSAKDASAVVKNEAAVALTRLESQGGAPPTH